MIVTVVERSKNSKLSHLATVSATMAPQHTCPGASRDDRHACKLLHGGCYAEHGRPGFTTHRLNRLARLRKMSVSRMRLLAARMEAKLIRALSGLFQLRVHVVGDCATNETASIIGAAMVAHTAKYGRAAWTYTHAWRSVLRRSWQGANVLASVETIAEIAAARARGYASAIVLPAAHVSTKAYQVQGETIVPCPAQFEYHGRRLITCETCTLCKRSDFLLSKRLTIGFAPDTGSESQLMILLTSKGSIR